MKKYILLLGLISIGFSSCKDDEPIELKTGLYELNIEGKSYCDPDNPEDYSTYRYIYITKIDNKTYSVYTTDGSGVQQTPKTQLKVYDVNKLSGKITVFIGSGRMNEGEIEGEISEDGKIITGKYRGRYYCQSSTAPVKGVFTINYEELFQPF